MSDQAQPKKTNVERLVEIVATAATKARTEVEPDLQRHKWNATTDYLESMEDELRPLMGEVFGHYLDRADLPESMRPLLELMVDPEHQFDVLLQLVGLFGALVVFLPTFGQIEIRQLANQLNRDYAFIPLNAQDAAAADIRGYLSPSDAADQAAQTGVGAGNFEIMRKLAIETLGVSDLLALYRTGVIEWGFVEKQLQLRQFDGVSVSLIQHLATQFMGIGDALGLAVRHIVDMPTAKALFESAGGRPDQFELLYKVAAQPISIGEALTFWNHGEISEAQVDRVLQRSPIDPEFYAMAKLARHRFLSAIQIKEVLAAGDVTPELATKWLLADGFPEDQVAAFVSAHASSSVAKAKTETEAMIVEEYTLRIINRATATSDLAKLGYTVEAADVLLEIADAKVSMAERKAAVSRVRAAYVGGHIERTAAAADLSKLSIDQAAVTQWLEAWDVEKGTISRSFTEAQVGTFVKAKLITTENALERWVTMGYSLADAAILLEHYTAVKPTTGNAPLPPLPFTPPR